MHRGNDDISGSAGSVSEPRPARELRAPRAPRPVGVGVRSLADLAAEVQSVVAGFDPEITSSWDCLDMVRVFSELEHTASAGLALAARRVAQTNLWERKGHRTPAHWLASMTGMSVGDAMRLLETAEVAEQAPATMDALKNGDLSTREANASGKAEVVDPEAGAELVRRAIESDASVREIEQDSARIVNAASGDTEAERAARIREERSFRIGSNGDGKSWMHASGPTAEIARFEAAIRPMLNDIFMDARQEGRREPVEAYQFDAVMGLARRPRPDAGAGAGKPNGASTRSSGSSTSIGSGASPAADGPGIDRLDGEVGEDWSFAKVIARVDLTALDRGFVEPGELCEIAGLGPVPVADIWKMIDGGAFVAGIATRGSKIDSLVHYGRRPTVLQRTVLDWETAGTCVVEGCNNKVRIEIDHTHDWAATHVTQIDDLAGLCRSCHLKKTHQGYRLGPRLPNGKRTLVPPRPPGTAVGQDDDGTRRPEPSGDGTRPTATGGRTGEPRRPDPPGLFDPG